MHDLIIRGAQVYDGLGNPPQCADVTIDAGRVSGIGSTREAARETVDAGGLALMPGIVDLHTHYDAQITWDRSMSPSPALGVTTAVMGNCGFGIAPCPAQLRETMMKNLSVVEGMDLTALLTGVRWEFETFAEYMTQLRRIGPYLNTAVFAGHSVIRTTVMGEAASERATPTATELDAMRRLVREAMDAGAIGFASSFSPNHSGFAGRPMPSTIAGDDELRALTRVLGEVGRGVFMSATGPRATPAVMESIAAENGRPAFISTVLTMYNEAAPERAMTYYEACAAAQDRGHEVVILSNCQPLSFDFTLDDPYVMLSHSAFDAIKGLDRAGRKAVYADASFRARFRADLAQPKPGIIFLGNWERIEVSIATLPRNKACEGQSIAALARARGCDAVDLFCDLALEEDLATHFLGKFFQNDDDGVAPLLKHRAGVITLSDAGAHLIYMCDAGFGLHFLGHWVRDTGHFELAEGIRRITSDPARRFRIPERGRLAVGAPADLLLFDPARVGISRPRVVADLPGGGSRTVRDPRGVHGVWVNGIKVHDGTDYARLTHGPGAVLDRFEI
ncbi:MAG: amidohydrolase family protein [Burkholderiales bacterium]|nr:amidohydrolase family protein [Burkholderiales bacterium]